MLAYTVAGYGVVSMDVRGQSGYSTDGDRSPLGNTVKGQIIRGAVEGPDELFYKDIYLDPVSYTHLDRNNIKGIGRTDSLSENSGRSCSRCGL